MAGAWQWPRRLTCPHLLRRSNVDHQHSDATIKFKTTTVLCVGLLMGFFQQIRTQRQRSRRPNRRSSVKFWRKLKKFQITKSRASHQFQTHFIQRNRKRRVLHDFRPLQSIDGVPGTLTRHARFFFSLLSRTVTHQHLRTRQTIFGGQKIIRQNGGNEKVKKCQPKKW